MTALGSGKIWILVPDWSRLKSSEPKAGDVTHKIGPLYFIIHMACLISKYSYATPHYAIFAATLFWIGSKKTWVKLFSSFFPQLR